MLSIGLLSLIGAPTSGVFGFGTDVPDGWTWEKGSFFILMLLAAAAFVGSTTRRPSLLSEVLDDIQAKRFQNRVSKDEVGHSHQATRLSPVGLTLTDRAEQDAVTS